MGGGEAGRNLYGAFKTLYLQGRFSRTQPEQALTFRPNFYPEYVQLLLRSLPPSGRSMYAAKLYNSNFKGIKWDIPFYTKPHRQLEREGFEHIQPAAPLGDDRHAPVVANIVAVASAFHCIFDIGFLFDGNAGDTLAPLADRCYFLEMTRADEDGDDILSKHGSVFGIDPSTLGWGSGTRFDQRENDDVSTSEIVLRTWSALYFAERLSKTELEHAPERTGRDEAAVYDGSYVGCWPPGKGRRTHWG